MKRNYVIGRALRFLFLLLSLFAADRSIAAECSDSEQRTLHDKLVGTWLPKSPDAALCLALYEADGQLKSTCKSGTSHADFVYEERWDVDKECRFKLIQSTGGREWTITHQLHFSGNDEFAISDESEAPPYSRTFVRKVDKSSSITSGFKFGKIPTQAPPPELSASPPTAIPIKIPNITIASPLNYSSVKVPSQLTVTTDVHVEAGTSIAKVDFFQGTSLLGTTTLPPYNFNWRIQAPGANVLWAQVTDSKGTTAKSPLLIVSANKKTVLSVKLPSGLHKSVVDSNDILVQGTVQAPANSSITLNRGVSNCIALVFCFHQVVGVGTITDDGTFYFNNVALQPGENSFRVTVTDADGNNESVPLKVTNVTAAPFGFSMSENEGMAPFSANFFWRGDEVQTYSVAYVSCNATRSEDLKVEPSSRSASMGSCLYASPGLYSPTLTVYSQLPDGSLQVAYSRQLKVYVHSEVQLDAKLQGVIALALSRLSNQDISGAMNLFAGETEATYKEVFSKVGSGLHDLVSSFSAPQAGKLETETATYFITRKKPEGGETGGPVMMLRGSDHIWRIDGM